MSRVNRAVWISAPVITLVSVVFAGLLTLIAEAATSNMAWSNLVAFVGISILLGLHIAETMLSEKSYELHRSNTGADWYSFSRMMLREIPFTHAAFLTLLTLLAPVPGAAIIYAIYRVSDASYADMIVLRKSGVYDCVYFSVFFVLVLFRDPLVKRLLGYGSSWKRRR